MKIIVSARRDHYVARASTFLIMVALIAGMVGCVQPVIVEYDLTISSTDGGNVTIPGEGTRTYDEGEVVNLVAEAEEGYGFVEWTGDLGTITDASDATTTITMNGDYSITASFQAEQVVIYDFVAEASDNRTVWQSGTGESYEWTLTFPGATDNSRGFALYRTDVVLEDNRTYDKVLQTHPQWVDNGFINGAYVGLWDMGYKVETGDHFYAKVGFLKNATEGNVKFIVWCVAEGLAISPIVEITDTYDGMLKTIDIDLSPWADDVRVTFALEVRANGPSGQDWATWVEAKIIRE